MFKNKSLLVTPVNTQEATNQEQIAPPRPTPEAIFQTNMLIRENLDRVVKAVLIYKFATTALRAAEHVVVTKVK